MNFITTAVPTWVIISFILTFPLFFYFIANAAKKAATSAGFEAKKVSKIGNSILIFGAIYLIYVSLMSFTGIFQQNALPPRILLFTALPLTVFYFAIVFRSEIYWKLLEYATLESLIRLHIFRFIGAYFLITWSYGALPKTFALVGGIGDIFAATTAIFVATAVENRKSYNRKLAFIWNIVGFWDIINVLVSAFYFSKLSLETNTKGILEMGNFPFCWIPAVAPATIIFLHISIFKKLKSRR
jgi:hypothetical protein